MKARIVQGGIGSYEVQVKQAWLMPWQTLYDGSLPWRGSKAQALKLIRKLKKI